MKSSSSSVEVRGEYTTTDDTLVSPVMGRHGGGSFDIAVGMFPVC